MVLFRRGSCEVVSGTFVSLWEAEILICDAMLVRGRELLPNWETLSDLEVLIMLVVESSCGVDVLDLAAALELVEVTSKEVVLGMIAAVALASLTCEALIDANVKLLLVASDTMTALLSPVILWVAM
jgi:hypothetical protein